MLIIRIPFFVEWRSRILFITEWGIKKAKKTLRELGRRVCTQ
jgi:hypothetical protein